MPNLSGHNLGREYLRTLRGRKTQTLESYKYVWGGPICSTTDLMEGNPQLMAFEDATLI